jgi:hypothetical protein
MPNRDEFEKALEEMKKETIEAPKEPVVVEKTVLLASSSVPEIPRSIGVTSILSMLLTALPMLLKNLPLIIGVLAGLSKFFSNFKPAPGVDVVIDQESLAKLIEELVEREVDRIVNSHKDRIRVWVPSDEDKEREAKLDELEELLKKDKEEYEKRHPKT